VLAATGAYLVGFGAPLNLFGSRPLLLLVVTLVIGVSAVAGSIAAAHGIAALLLAGALGWLCGRAAERDAATAWIAVQCALAGVIATNYPASLDKAAERAALIFTGGIAQTVVLSVARLVLRFPPPSPPERSEERFAAHLSIALVVALAAERALGLRNGYWAPATTLLVLRPTMSSTMARALSRTAGTLVGVVLASALLMASHPPLGLVGALVLGAAFGAYLFQRATYGLFSTCVGMYVVFVRSLLGAAEEEIAVARVIATLLGAAIGLAVQLADDLYVRKRGTGAS
jgi:hypothetical protein